LPVLASAVGSAVSAAGFLTKFSPSTWVGTFGFVIAPPTTVVDVVLVVLVVVVPLTVVVVAPVVVLVVATAGAGQSSTQITLC
jgi:hypothetical protein